MYFANIPQHTFAESFFENHLVTLRVEITLHRREKCTLEENFGHNI
jgi:hypothetical protein